MTALRLRYTVLSSIFLLFILLSTFFYRSGVTFDVTNNDIPPKPILSQLHDVIDRPLPPPPIYKPTPSLVAIPIVDNFPLAASAHSPAELPPIPSWNTPPNPHVEDTTPLFIGFTRNWALLQQVVVSYITSGWPAEDIYVVENTGVMDSNTLGLLSLQNPFFLNHTRLQMLGVNILVTPTLLTFAQLQNFYLSTATEKDWPHFFWSHMDVVVLSLESDARFPPTNSPPSTHEPWESQTLYSNCLDSLREVSADKNLKWASVFFSYDRLALVNVAAFKNIGAWDTMIPFYMTDCDMHARLTMAGYKILERKVGLVFDIGSAVEDLVVYYRQKRGPDGEVKEATWVDPYLLEQIQEGEAEAEAAGLGTLGWLKRDEVVTDKRGGQGHGKFDRDERAKENRDEDAEHKAWALAARFVRQPRSSSPNTTSDPPPRSKSKQDSSLWTPDTPSSSSFTHLTDLLLRMQSAKSTPSNGRNSWQARQSGGQGEPFYRNSAGFEKAILMTIDIGRRIYTEKWGHRGCDIYEMGYSADDAWRVEHDFKGE